MLLPYVDKLASLMTSKALPAISGFLQQMQDGTGKGGEFAAQAKAAEARAAELGSAPVVHVAVDGWDRDALVGLLAIWAAEGTAVLSDRPRDEALQRDLAAERVGLTWS